MLADIKIRRFLSLLFAVFTLHRRQLFGHNAVVYWTWRYPLVFRVWLHVGKPFVDPGGIDRVVSHKFSSVILQFIHDVALETTPFLLIFVLQQILILIVMRTHVIVERWPLLAVAHCFGHHVFEGPVLAHLNLQVTAVAVPEHAPEVLRKHINVLWLFDPYIIVMDLVPRLFPLLLNSVSNRLVLDHARHGAIFGHKVPPQLDPFRRDEVVS